MERHSSLLGAWCLAKHQNLAAKEEEAEASLPGRLQSDSNTRVGSALGTPQLMSPEQANGSLDELTRRTDVYSLGGVLFSMIADSPSVEGSSGYEIVSNVQQGKVKKLLSAMPAGPRPLCSICDKAMRHEGSARYETALQLGRSSNGFQQAGNRDSDSDL